MSGPPALRALRWRSQRLGAPVRSVRDAASALCATQGQEFWGGRLALAARTRGAPTIGDVDRVFDRGEIVRSWTMRGTLHITVARDLRWILGVTGERMLRSARTRHLGLGLDAEAMSRAEVALVGALAGGNALTRAEAFAVLSAAGVDPAGQRGYHVLFALAVRAIVCWGPVVERAGRPTREQRIVLLDEWIAESAAPEDPLTEFFVRYTEGHGPATPADFAWWSGLPIGMARQALAAAGDRVRPFAIGDETLWVSPQVPRTIPAAPEVLALPPFEEYFLCYADRTRVCAPELLAAIGPGINGIVHPVIVARGEVVGVWRQPLASATAGQRPTAELFDPHAATAGEVEEALDRFAAFIAD